MEIINFFQIFDLSQYVEVLRIGTVTAMKIVRGHLTKLLSSVESVCDTVTAYMSTGDNASGITRAVFISSAFDHE